MSTSSIGGNRGFSASCQNDAQIGERVFGTMEDCSKAQIQKAEGISNTVETIYRKLIAAKDVEGLVALGKMYYYVESEGVGDFRPSSKCFSSLEKASGYESEEARFVLLWHCVVATRPWFLKGNMESGKFFIQKSREIVQLIIADKQDVKSAAYSLYMLAQNMYLGRKNSKEAIGMAVSLSEQVSSLGSVAANSVLGRCYERGIGVNKDVKKAIDLYTSGTVGVSCGAVAECYYRLGRCYEEGIGVQKDVDKAVALYKESIGTGLFYPKGANVPDNLSRRSERRLVQLGRREAILS